MKFEFPDTGEGVTEGQFLEWKVSEGDRVEEDQVVGEAETDKAVVDIPAPANGTVESLKVAPGDNVEVGEVIMELNTEEVSNAADEESSEPEEHPKSIDNEESSDPATRSDNVDAVMGGAPSASSYSGEDEENTEEASETAEEEDILALPKVRKLAEEKDVDLESLDIDGRIREKDVLEASEEVSETENVEKDDKNSESGEKPEGDVNARPSVRKLAREHDIEISMVDGSGRGGEITREDILEIAGDSEEKDIEADTEDIKRDKPNEKEASDPVREAEVERVEMSGVRKVTADRMSQSSDEAAHVTHIVKADITELVELRESVKSDVDAHLTYLPFIMKACVAGLKEHPDLNSELDEGRDEIIRKKFYDFNIAVDTDKGLLVPKIDNVGEKNMVELASSIADKASRAQNNELDKSEMSPGTFSITNLGVIGGEAFTPIIYPPQSAILGIGKIQETAEVVNGEVVPRKTVKLCLSYDHRVVDGAEAARFMNKVLEDLENPKNLILDI